MSNERIPLSWAIARGRDALIHRIDLEMFAEEIKQDQEAADALDRWLRREWERTKSKRKSHNNG